MEKRISVFLAIALSIFFLVGSIFAADREVYLNEVVSKIEKFYYRPLSEEQREKIKDLAEEAQTMMSNEDFFKVLEEIPRVLEDKYSYLVPKENHTDGHKDYYGPLVEYCRDGNTGYIKIRVFRQERTSKEVQDALKNLRGVKGIVLDLRGNPGGSNSATIETAGLLLENKELERRLVKIKATSAGFIPIFIADRYVRQQFDGKLAILVNKKTASAAEMLASLLQGGKNIIVGTPTFGKHCSQATFRVHDRWLRLTVANFYLPNTSGGKIMPDIWTDDPDQQMAEAIAYLQ